MGKRGPKPKPTAQRAFEGDPGRLLGSREGEVAPPIPASMPNPPEWLGAIGCLYWEKTVPVLYPLGLLTDTDCDLLALYCQAWEEFITANELVEEDGLVVSEMGKRKANPAVAIRNSAALKIRQIGSEFAMGPASRIGMNIQPADESDEIPTFKIA
jgi:P27 family predicted phage terminase small subunit